MRKIVLSILMVMFSCSGAEAQEALFYFDKEPFVHPRIIQEFASPFPLDDGDQVVAINLLDSNKSDRFFGDIEIRKIEKKNPLVCFSKKGEEFCYQYIGKTDSGLDVLYASEWYGGSAVYKDLIFVKLEKDQSFSLDMGSLMMRKDYDRLLIKKMGIIDLGDRYKGELAVNGNDIFIGEDIGWFAVSGGIGGGWLSQDRKDRIVGIEAE